MQVIFACCQHRRFLHGISMGTFNVVSVPARLPRSVQDKDLSAERGSGTERSGHALGERLEYDRGSRIAVLLQGDTWPPQQDKEEK